MRVHPFTEISIEEEDSETILEISKERGLMSLIQRSIAPSIFCYRHIRPCETLLSVATLWRSVKEAE